MVSQNGAMNVTDIAAVMSTVATIRRPPVARWTRSSSGHVATTIVAAQIDEPRNGSSVHRLPKINAPIIRTTRIMRVRSLGA